MTSKSLVGRKRGLPSSRLATRWSDSLVSHMHRLDCHRLISFVIPHMRRAWQTHLLLFTQACSAWHTAFTISRLPPGNIHIAMVKLASKHHVSLSTTAQPPVGRCLAGTVSKPSRTHRCSDRDDRSTTSKTFLKDADLDRPARLAAIAGPSK